MPIQSRMGNLVLVGVGAIFVIAGIATLVFALVSTWGYASLTDRAMQIVLVGCAAFGAFLILGAWKNLGRGQQSHHAA